MSITGLSGVFGLHRQIGRSDNLNSPNMTAKGPYNAGVASNPNQTTVQSLAITATGGTYRLGFRGEVTTALAYNANAATIEDALEALPNGVVEAGDITVTGGSSPYTISLASGRYAQQPVGVTIAEQKVSGGSVAITNSTYGGRWYYLPATSVNFQPQQIQQSIPPEVGGSLFARGSYKGGVHGEGQVMMVPRGGLGLAELFYAFTGGNIVETDVVDNFGQAVNEVHLIEGSGTIGGGTWTVTVNGQTTGTIAHSANAATIQTALEALSNVEPGDVMVSGGPIASDDVELAFSGNLGGQAVTVTVNDASLTGTDPELSISVTTEGLPMANKLVGDGSNGVQVGAFKYRFIPQSGARAELPWYTLVRNVAGMVVEEFGDARLGNFAFDVANAGILNIDASFVSRACGTIAPGSGVSSISNQEAANGMPFQSVDAMVMLDTNTGSGPGEVGYDEKLLPTRLNIGFANQLSTNEHVVGSFYLQDITNQARSANVTYSVYLTSPELYMRTYANGASAQSDAAWSSQIWKGKLFLGMSGDFINGNSGDRYKIEVNIPEMDYMATPIALAGNNLVEYQLTTNVVLSQDPTVHPFWIDYTTDEDII